MSTPPSSPKPDQGTPAWAFQDEEPHSAPAKLPPGYRPGALTAVSIIAIVLGVLGLLMAASAILMSLFGSQVQQWQMGMGAGPQMQDALDLQAEMNAELIAISKRYRLANLVVGALQVALAAALATGGVWTLGLKESGRKLLWAACGLAILFELGRAVPTAMMQLENMALMEDYFPRMMEASSPNAQGEQAAAFGKMVMRFSTIVQWVIFAGWLLLKLAFFGVAFYYLSRPKTKALFVR